MFDFISIIFGWSLETCPQYVCILTLETVFKYKPRSLRFRMSERDPVVCILSQCVAVQLDWILKFFGFDSFLGVNLFWCIKVLSEIDLYNYQLNAT